MLRENLLENGIAETRIDAIEEAISKLYDAITRCDKGNLRIVAKHLPEALTLARKHVQGCPLSNQLLDKDIWGE